MNIAKLRIINYKIFQDETIELNPERNIFVGENNSGKTTILEALIMVLTGKLNGIKLENKLSLDWFNYKTRQKFINDVKNNVNPGLPSIEIEAFFSTPKENEINLIKFRGTNNSLHEDYSGVKLEIIFDEQYSEIYKQLLEEKKIEDIPIEYYKVSFCSFAIPEYYCPTTRKKVAVIDATKKENGTVLGRYISNSINEYLTEEEMTELRHAYRANRKDFTENQAVRRLNDKLQESHNFEGKIISINLRDSGIDEWKNDMSISLDDIPLENSGIGTQNMFKTEIFLLQNTDIDVLIIEEPETSLSYANMSILISKLANNTNRQLFISTHSSFVANKLGLQCLHLISNGQTKPFYSLSKETYEYFLKLPGYNTLRILLANKAILVEGPSDELIIQRAYIDHYGKQPIDDGIDIVAVDSLAFSRYCELATLIQKHITIVTDNDSNVDAVKKKYEQFGDWITLCVEQNNQLNTLEPSVLSANVCDFEKFKSIIYCGKDKNNKNEEDIKQFMVNNKTEWSMRVFCSSETINYPKYILESIGIKAGKNG